MAKNEKSIKGFGDLKNLGVAVRPGATPPAQAHGQTARATPAAVRTEPARIENASRAGRAPYNFVPLPDRCATVPKPPDADQYTDLSGEIDIELTAVTDFYTRGMWQLDDYDAIAKPVSKQFEPFRVNGQLRLPGSTLRGMTRTLVEILGKAPLDPVNDDQLFFRTVAATDSPSDRNSFEPQAVAYWGQIGKLASKVRAGYLYASAAGWRIQPAKLPAEGPGYRVLVRDPRADVWRQQRVRFEPDGNRDVRIVQAPRGEEGTMVWSGYIQRKRRQWVIRAEDPKQDQVPIPDHDVEAYKETGRSQEIRRHKADGFEYHEGSHAAPCFFIEWADKEGRRHVSFGHTPYFRVPYQRTVQQAVPKERQRPDDGSWDLAEAIFGRVPRVVDTNGTRRTIVGQRGRVYFEDARLQSGSPGTFENRPSEIVLGAPKPTTYQHYLVQRSDGVADAIHWDGDRRENSTVVPVVRGHKLYWHRPQAPVRLAEAKQRNVSTQLSVAHAGARFVGRIRYENLRPFELGALLTALDLPPGCAHKLGMGKPLGLGSFRIRLKAVRQIDRLVRYRRLFANLGEFETGFSTVASSVDSCKQSFAGWYLLGDPEKTSSVDALWQDARLKELKALLTLEGLPAQWNDITRYLEFGKLASGPLAGNTYNEYQHCGYPPNRILEKRRPLPPATQVLAAGPAIPKDGRPLFDGPKLANSLRRGQ